MYFQAGDPDLGWMLTDQHGQSSSSACCCHEEFHVHWYYSGSLCLSVEEGDEEECLAGSGVHALDNSTQRAALSDFGNREM